MEEVVILLTVVEKHLNVSTKAMIAEDREQQEVKTVALQNHMALDPLLASQGGTCQVIGTEWFMTLLQVFRNCTSNMDPTMEFLYAFVISL